jgi:phosphotransferase system enzyme I (PtsI)
MPRNQEIIYQGVAASPGVAIGPVHVVARGFSAPEVYSISAERVDDERARFGRALEITKRQLTDLQQRIKGLSGEEEGRIFEAHLMILEDRTVLDRVFEAIEGRLQNAEFAFYAVMQNFLEAMRRINDPYLRDRTADVEDICQRVLRNFREIRITDPAADTTPGHQHILVAYDLSPSDTAAMNRSSVLGFATEIGSVNSHTAILARSLGLPAVVGLQDVVFDIETLSPAILDGYSGRIIINPADATLEFYRKLEQEKREARTALESQREAVSQTRDGHLITLSANIEFVHELPWVAQSGAKGIGLFRTEFLLLDGEEVADEAKQTDVYTEIAKSVAPHPVIIRTLDAGGDKLPAEPLSEPEPNPFLGWRGIRVSLARHAMFKEQLRAILRASAHGKAAIMFPLISGLGEVLEAKRLLAECMDELNAKDVPFDEEIEVGVMIEVPSAAILADLIAPHVDFMSIGTNDLIQYTVAVDRVNHHVADLYRPTNPAVVRLIRKTVEAADANGIWTGVCGEMAGDLRFTPLLIGLGVSELSVGTHQVPQVRQAIRSLNHLACEAMVTEAMLCSRSAQILDLTCGLARQCYPELLD